MSGARLALAPRRRHQQHETADHDGLDDRVLAGDHFLEQREEEDPSHERLDHVYRSCD
jgi:hypothetical protein